MSTKPKKPEAPLNGREYVALVRVCDKDNATLAAPGQTCENVPETALKWLVQQGRVERKRGDDKAPEDNA